MAYMGTHWRGEFSIVWSFWINIVALRIVIYLALGALHVFGALPVILLVAVLAVDIAAFVWQTVGFVRAGEAYCAGYGSQIPIWGAYLAIVPILFLSAAQWWGLFLAAGVIPEEELFTDRMDRLHAATYRLDVSADRRTIRLDGDIALGITKRMTQVLRENGDIAAIVLTSTGGNIFEARGLARLLIQNSLNTHVKDQCSSACTIVFMAGETRTMDDDARLGFHQYRLDMRTGLPNVRTTDEQDRDRAFFRERGIAETFLGRIFDSPADNIWFPDRQELIAARVISPGT